MVEVILFYCKNELLIFLCLFLLAIPGGPQCLLLSVLTPKVLLIFLNDFYKFSCSLLGGSHTNGAPSLCLTALRNFSLLDSGTT